IFDPLPFLVGQVAWIYFFVHLPILHNPRRLFRQALRPPTRDPPPRLWATLAVPRSRACAAAPSVSPWPGAGARALPPPRGAPPRGAAHSLPPALVHTAAATGPPAAPAPCRGAPAPPA